MPKTIENIRDVGNRESVRCPKCGTTVNTEYLTYATATGEIVWCGFCKPLTTMMRHKPADTRREGREGEQP